MIVQLAGTLLEATAHEAVLDVSGIGYELGISGATAASLPPCGSSCRLYTRLQVREDNLSLFGFWSKEERLMFDRLLAVSGVGSRLALAILSTFSISQLYSIVMAEDDKQMAQVSGVGKKTAQRLILELKSVFEKDRVPIGASEPLPLTAVRPVSAASAVDDARAALLSMGFSSQEADLALDGADEDKPVEALLAAALKRLGMDA